MKILKENKTHKAVKTNGKINIVLKGIKIDDLVFRDEILYSIPLENEEDLLCIFEQIEEENRYLFNEANELL